MNTSHHIHSEIARDVQARRIAEARVAATARRRTAAEAAVADTRRWSLIPAFLTRAARAAGPTA